MRKLSLEEVKKIQVEMLVDFDSFCRKNNITYFLAYGTLLGAIRHKGYIPWDDDIDVMVPRPEIEKLVKSYHSDKYAIIDTDNDSLYEFPYPRMVSKNTFLKKGFFARTYGVFIDIYPIDAFPASEEGIQKYRDDLEKVRKVRAFWIRLRNKVFKYLPISWFPFVREYTKKHREVFRSIPYHTSCLVHACNASNTPLNKYIFEDRVEVEFEGNSFFAPVGWDEFLKNSYGDYMQLPPEEQRHPYHGSGNYYIID